MPTSGSGPKPFCIGAGRLGEGGGKGKMRLRLHRPSTIFVQFENLDEYPFIVLFSLLASHGEIRSVDLNGMCKRGLKFTEHNMLGAYQVTKTETRMG